MDIKSEVKNRRSYKRLNLYKMIDLVPEGKLALVENYVHTILAEEIEEIDDKNEVAELESEYSSILKDKKENNLKTIEDIKKDYGL